MLRTRGGAAADGWQTSPAQARAARDRAASSYGSPLRVTLLMHAKSLLVHILDTALVRVSPEAYNAVIGAYQTPLMGVAEIGLVGAVVFHAFNGLRIILVDFWNIGARHHVAMFYVVLSLWVVTMLAFTPRHLMNVFGW